jgi:hypothetical protein
LNPADPSGQGGTGFDGIFDLGFDEPTNLAINDNGLCNAPEYIDLKAASNGWVPPGSSLGDIVTGVRVHVRWW